MSPAPGSGRPGSGARDAPGTRTPASASSARASPPAGRTPIDLPLDGAHTTFIEASAGTGKTHALTTIAARLVVEEGWPIDRILVVTFTRAAAAELRERIRRIIAASLAAVKARIAEAGSGDPGAGKRGAAGLRPARGSEGSGTGEPEPAVLPAAPGTPADPVRGTLPGEGRGDPQARELLRRWEHGAGDGLARAARRLEAAVRDIDRVNVYTIHGFCQRVLSDLAFESGFPFGFEVSGGDGERVDRAVRDAWRRRLYPVSLLLMRHAVGKGFLPRELGGWVSAGRAKTGLRVLGGEPLAEPIEVREAAWRDVFETVRTEWERHGDTFRAEVLGGGWLKRQSYRRDRICGELAGIEALFAASEPRLPGEGMAGRYGREQLSRACKKDSALPENPLFDGFDRLEQASRELRSAYDQWLRWTRREILAEVRESLRRRIRDDRVLGYDDLLIALEDALESADGARLAQRIRREFSCALIDEYQDSDPVQSGIFDRIYGEARAEPAGLPAQDPADGGDSGTGHGIPSSDPAQVRSGPLVVVGDPKQSIYRFRGADVFAYFATRRAAHERLSLERNWRSVPGLVEAVNAVFSASAPFVVPEIEYRPAASARPGGNPLRIAPDARGEPLQLWLLPRLQEGCPHTKTSVNPIVSDAVAREIGRLLALAAHGEATVGDRPLTGADVAVLVRTREQGRRVADALRARGVRCVEIDDGSVFDTREAEQIERFLWALAEPGREARVRGALAGDLFGLDTRALFALQEHQEVRNGWAERLAEWRADWEARGIGPLLHRMLEGEGGAERLLARRGGARRLTNFRHLADLLQEAQTRRQLAPPELTAWLNRRRNDSARPDDSVQLRLESDEQLVKVLTVHGAKGLEFPVVFCPFAWDARRGPRGRPGAGDEEAAYHLGERQGYREVLDLRPDGQARDLARREEFSESVRLLYVALTRAKYRCVVAWGQVRDAGYSPLAWLLHRPRDEVEHGPAAEDGSALCAVADGAAGEHSSAAGSEAVVAALDATAARFEDLSAPAWLSEVEAYAQRFPDAVSVRVLDPERCTVHSTALREAPPPVLAARELGRPLRRIRQMTSFSALSAEARSAGAGPGGGPPAERDYAETDRPDHDQREEASDHGGEEGSGSGGAGHERSAFTFPRGPAAGSCLHFIFERLDGPSGTRSGEGYEPDPDALCRTALERFGIEGEWRSAARAMVERTRAVCLEASPREGSGGRKAPARGGEVRGRSGGEGGSGTGAGNGFRLGDPVRRFVEFEFHFPVAGLDRGRLGAQLAEHAYPNPFAEPGEAPPPLPPIHGFLRGFVDLVVEHEGRWYVIDYKSNWLGPAPADYRPQALARAMRAGGYSLQYLVYLVALHRYLSMRLPGYDYERHVGGAFYLFVRAVDPAAGMRRGVYFDRPSAECLHALDACFRGEGT